MNYKSNLGGDDSRTRAGRCIGFKNFIPKTESHPECPELPIPAASMLLVFRKPVAPPRHWGSFGRPWSSLGSDKSLGHGLSLAYK